MPNRTFSTRRGDEVHTWAVPALWEASEGLTVFEYDVSRFDALDLDVWFCGVNEPTIRAVLDHHRRIRDADWRFPIILSAKGEVMDGVHRICRALTEHRLTIPAVQFVSDPPPTARTPA
ncbi:MAG: hypothetical protein AB8I08_02080 [Sandaracinaceae bacterium]